MAEQAWVVNFTFENDQKMTVVVKDTRLSAGDVMSTAGDFLREKYGSAIMHKCTDMSATKCDVVYG